MALWVLIRLMFSWAWAAIAILIHSLWFLTVNKRQLFHVNSALNGFLCIFFWWEPKARGLLTQHENPSQLYSDCGYKLLYTVSSKGQSVRLKETAWRSEAGSNENIKPSLHSQIAFTSESGTKTPPTHCSQGAQLQNIPSLQVHCQPNYLRIEDFFLSQKKWDTTSINKK